MTVSTGGRRATKRLTTWRSLRAATLELTDELGWDAVSIELVAERADVSPRTVFNYFRSKDALIFEPDPQMGEELVSFVSSLPAGTPLWSGLEQMVLSVLSKDMAKLATIGRLLRDQPELFHTASSYYAGVQEQIAAAFGHRLPDAAPQIAARATSAAALGVMTAAVTEWDAATGIDGLHDLVRAGFAATSTDTAELLLASHDRSKPSPSNRKK
ncbi:MAG: helix-turn-helix domain-containing protein [Actinomycetota bacterium]